MPTLLVHGDGDRVVPSSHSVWLADAIPDATLWHEPDDGHIAILRRAPDALQWLVERA